MNEAAATVPLPPALLERLRRDLNAPDVRARLLAYARKRVGALRLAGIPTHDQPAHEAEILVQDAATSTILGLRRWDPELSLYEHLCGVIRSDTGHRVARAAKRQHVSVHASTLDDSTDGSARLDGSITSQRGDGIAFPGHLVSASDASRRLMHTLRDLAVDKPTSVGLLLDAYEAGCDGRKDVLATTKLTNDEYRNARRILDRMVRSLPADLNQGARDALEITHDA